MSGLSQEDFERLQTSLLELKNQNYILEDKLRKQKNELGDVTARATVLEQELGKAQKVIQKSKKSTDVQAIMKENESLQNKLISQEEEFRIQNQTLLDELSKLVANNETLESRLRERAKDSNGNSSFPQDVESSGELEKIRETLSALRNENDYLRFEIAKLTPEHVAKNSNCQSPDDSSDIVEVSEAGNVVFRRQSSTSLCSDKVETDQARKGMTSHLSEENSQLKNENRSLYEQMSHLQEKLKKKQESYLQLQQEKENLFTQMSEQLDELRSKKDEELRDSRDHLNRLQTQLNFGHSAFAEFRDKKSAEIETLNQEIISLKTEKESCSEEKNSMLVNEVRAMSEDLKSSQRRLIEITNEKEKLEVELSELKNVSAKNLQLEKEIKELSEKLEASQKKGESRKSLLDEMAVRLQTRTDEFKAEIQNLNAEICDNKSAIQKKEAEIEVLTTKIETLTQESQGLLAEKKDLSSQLQMQEDELQKLRSDYEKKLSDLKDTSCQELSVIKAEADIKIRDLTMQLEISNVQITEFEEQIKNLRQEIQDSFEDRKIMDKKHIGLVKDLKRQLRAEQQRNEKLAEKLKEVLADPTSFHEAEKASDIEHDRTSNSSWSIYSGHNELPREQNLTSTPLPRRGKTNSNDSLANAQNPAETSSSPGALYSTDDYRAMLSKISSLQEENISLQQRIQMLEHSSAAMVDDLMKKSKIIQFYCMEGKQTMRPSNSSSNILPNEKFKKMVEIFVHSTSETQKDELQRMQNMVEETLTKNMYLQQDLEKLSRQLSNAATK